jgi:hypothetical protein
MPHNPRQRAGWIALGLTIPLILIAGGAGLLYRASVPEIGLLALVEPIWPYLPMRFL